MVQGRSGVKGRNLWFQFGIRAGRICIGVSVAEKVAIGSGALAPDCHPGFKSAAQRGLSRRHEWRAVVCKSIMRLTEERRRHMSKRGLLAGVVGVACVAAICWGVTVHWQRQAE